MTPPGLRSALALTVLAGLALLLAVAAQPAAASGGIGVGALYGGEGTEGGQFGLYVGAIAVNESGTGGAAVGDLYVADFYNNRVQQFSPEGHFIRAFGADVGGAGVDVCTVASACQAGAASGSAGGMSWPTGIAVEQSTGNVYVTDSRNLRVDAFSATGAFEGAFGWGVDAGEPEESLQFCTEATGCQAGASGAGAGQFHAKVYSTSSVGAMAIDPTDGNLAVADNENRRVDEFSPTLVGGLVTGASFVRGFGWGAVDGGDEFQICTTACHAPGEVGTALGQFGDGEPRGLAFDFGGALYVQGNSFVPRAERTMAFDPARHPTGLFAEAVLPLPPGIAFDSATGHFLIAGSEAGEARPGIFEVDAAGNVLESYLRDSGLTFSQTFLAVDSASGAIYVADSKDRGFFTLGPIVPPTASIEPVSGMSSEPCGVSASFAGHVNPEGLKTGYRFEYSSDGAHWARVPEADLYLPSDSVEHEVGPLGVSCLEGSTEYQLRLVAQKIYDSGSASAETTFTTPAAAPIPSATSAAEVSDASILLRGTINPENEPTRYHFECVSEAGYAESGYAGAFDVPAGEEPSVEGGEAVEVSERAGGLSPATTYHCRLVATNSVGTVAGAEALITTYRSAAAGLPDGRAYEQASPVQKNGNSIQGEATAMQASADGERVTFFANGGLPGGEGAQEFPIYLATRASDGSGWSTQGMLPPAATGPSPFGKTLGWDEGLTAAYDANRVPGQSFKLYRRDNSTAGLEAIATGGNNQRFSFAAGSADGKAALFEEEGDQLASGAAASAPNTYVWDQQSSQLRLAGVLNNGHAPAEGSFAGPYDWFLGSGHASTAKGGASAYYFTQAEHALAEDGSAAFFTAKGSGQLYLRKNPLAAQSPVNGHGECTNAALACTVQVSASQKTNGAGAGGADYYGPQPAVFAGAAPDGSAALLISHEELTNDANTGISTIARSAPDGSGVEESFVPASASALAVDGSHVYWADPTTDSIGRAKLDGTEVEPGFIAGADNPQGVAVDGAHIYWTNAASGAEKTGTIGRAKLDGTEVEQSFVKNATNPQGIAVDGSSIFWANAGATEGTRKIGHASLAGTGVIQTYIAVGGTSGARGLAVSEAHVYWTNPATNAIGRATTTATEVTPALVAYGSAAAPRVSGPRGIAVGAGGIYWANAGTGAIAHAGLDGSGVEESFIPGRSQPGGVALDGSHLYWSEGRGDVGADLYRFDAQSGALTDLAPDPEGLGGAEVKGVLGMSEDASYVYFVANGVLAEGAPQGSCVGFGEDMRGACDLYLSHEGHLTYITQLDAEPKLGDLFSGDFMDWVPGVGRSGGTKNESTARVSADGRTLLFRSILPQTGYDNHDTPELYRYTLGGGVGCVSCNPTGAAPVGAASLQAFGSTLTGPNIPFAIQTRNLSADGKRAFFNTPDKLLPTDTNGVSDVYEWEADGSGSCHGEDLDGGCLYLISTGTSPEPSYFDDAGAEGRDAFFLTAQPLVGQDKDELVDVYDAREGGGIAAQNATEPSCEEEGCKPEASAPPAAASPSQPSGEGNVKPAPRPRCKKGFKRAKRHGKLVCVRVHKHKKHRRHKKHARHRHRQAKPAGRGR